MNCKTCGKNISGNAYQKVADWTFCMDCFEDLMNRSEKKPEPAENLQQNRLVKNESIDKKTSTVCGICNTEIKKGTEKRLGIWQLCESCHKDMTFRPKEELFPEDEATAADSPDEASEIDDQSPFLTNQTIPCKGCGRHILAVAAKEDGDDRLCPDCFYNKDKM
ncbi:MAG: hypothetical protein KKE44_14840 [Proteobacteria bacterium]|nr:hypothetical protein [Pseudomonadota bacterium]MBU1584005.1 hypothetical protein [Pseudomonadota bacterium]MBU2630911.1 hypothetical protein [Pseudomonadota bacterium]